MGNRTHGLHAHSTDPASGSGNAVRTPASTEASVSRAEGPGDEWRRTDTGHSLIQMVWLPKSLRTRPSLEMKSKAFQSIRASGPAGEGQDCTVRLLLELRLPTLQTRASVGSA